MVCERNKFIISGCHSMLVPQHPAATGFSEPLTASVCVYLHHFTFAIAVPQPLDIHDIATNVTADGVATFGCDEDGILLLMFGICPGAGHPQHRSGRHFGRLPASDVWRRRLQH